MNSKITKILAFSFFLQNTLLFAEVRTNSFHYTTKTKIKFDDLGNSATVQSSSIQVSPNIEPRILQELQSNLSHLPIEVKKLENQILFTFKSHLTPQDLEKVSKILEVSLHPHYGTDFVNDFSKLIKNNKKIKTQRKFKTLIAATLLLAAIVTVAYKLNEDEIKEFLKDKNAEDILNQILEKVKINSQVQK